ncbi:MAG: dTDP-4-dehydrorhamnose reductase [Burkholderiales bacterium]|nr:dTDP-4-dehydrorhamnose reductase [Burkholderiales bacterium]
MQKQKVLITGAKGMLGRTLMKVLSEDFVLIPTDKEECDITNKDKVREVIKKVRPDIILHCAAMTQVDDCESKEDLAELLNAKGTENVALAANEFGARLIYISTDYVFDGKKEGPYKETDQAGGAQTVYGKTKWEGEEAVKKICDDYVIARISWLYGPQGPSFVHTMLRLADGKHPVLKVVEDQRGNPTSTFAVARKLKEILNRPELKGVFHVTCEGATTWKDFAQKIFEIAGLDQKVEGCTTEEYPRPAPRPKNSALEKEALRNSGITPMPKWEDSLKEFMEDKSNF